MSGGQVALPRRRSGSARSRTQSGRARRGRSRAGRAAAVRRRRRFALALVALAGLGGLYWFWFRDSSLVAVSGVKVEGIGSRPADRRLRAALTDAAKQMTTLHVRGDLLSAAAKPFPLVQSVRATPSFPSDLTVTVTERRPAALIGSGSGAVPVAADGMVLRGLPAARLTLPRLPLAQPPGHPRLAGAVLQQALVLGAMPAPFRGVVERSGRGTDGVAVYLRGGVELRFGTAAAAAEKWRAAAAVLADPQLGALDYVDLRVPARPAVGGVGHTPPPLPSP